MIKNNKRPEVFLHTLNRLIDTQYNAIDDLLRDYDIKAELSAETIINALVAYKEPFLLDLYDALNNRDCGCSQNGQLQLLHTDGADDKYNAFKKYFSDAVKVFKGIAIFGDAADKALNDEEGTAQKEEEKQAEKRIFGISQSLFYMLVVALVVLIAIILFVKYGKG